jgi:hypothetical protein
MVFKVTPKAATPAASIKDGTYRATVSNLKQFANTYGERIGFEFTISGGQFDGEKVMRSTAPQLTKQSKLAEVIEGILGRELTDKELQGGFDLEDLIDKECSILVLQSKSKTGAVYSAMSSGFSTPDLKEQRTNQKANSAKG